MKIQTKYDIHQRVHYCDFNIGKIYDFYIESISIKISLMYSGGGGTIGQSVYQTYYDNDRDSQAGINLYKTRKDAQKAIDDYNKRFPTKRCPECGTKVAIEK